MHHLYFGVFALVFALCRLVLEQGFDFVTWRAFCLGSIFGGALHYEAGHLEA